MAERQLSDYELTQMIYSVVYALYSALAPDPRREFARALDERVDLLQAEPVAESIHDLLQALEIAFPEDFRRT